MTKTEKAPDQAPPSPDHLKLVVDNTKTATEAPAKAETPGGAQTPSPEKAAGFWSRAKERFSSVGEKIQYHSPLGDIASSLERSSIRHGFKAIDIERLESSYQRADRKSIKVGVAYSATEKAVKEKEEAIKKLTELEEASEKSGPVLASLKIARAGERALLTKQLEAAQMARDKVGVKLEKYNDKKAVWENKQKLVAGEVLRTVNEHARPYQERFDSIRTKSEQNVAKMDGCKKEMGEIQEEIKRIEAQMQAAQSRGLRYEYKKEIANLRSGLSKAQKNLDTFYRDQIGIDKKLSKANTRLGNWKVVENQFTRVMNRERTYQRPTRENLTPNEARRDYSFTPSPEKAEDMQITPREYLDLWNKQYPQAPIPLKAFEDMLAPLQANKKFNSGIKSAVPEVEKFMSTFLVEYAKTKKIDLPPEALKDRFNELRIEIVKQNS